MPEKEHETDPRLDWRQLVEKISASVSTGGAVSLEAAVAIKMKKRMGITGRDNIVLDKPRLMAFKCQGILLAFLI